ncbi:MAG: response regulator [Candidatus Krumholzibacteriia bacterium]
MLIIGLVLACLILAALGGWQHLLVRRQRAKQAGLENRIAELKLAEDRLRERLAQAQRMEAVGVFAGSIIHNLNNLLAVILGHARLAAQGAPEESRCQDELNKVLKAGHLAGDLVKDLSDFFRQADLARKPTDLLPVVRDTVKLMRDILPRTIEIETDLEPCGPVLASATGVQQVLMNLCSNSVQAMLRSQGRISISLKEEEIGARQKALPQDLEPGSYVCLSVRDNGRGMDPATLDRITAAYYGDDPAAGQAGLGLATVCRILKHHHGVTIPSSSPGSGTTFTLYFPLIAWSVPAFSASQPVIEVPAVATASEPTVPATRVAAVAGPGARPEIRVLLVDDEEMVAAVMARGLRHLGFSVIKTTDSREALRKFQAGPEAYDVLVTDQIMPHMSGVRLAREIHALRPGLPIILTTGFRDSFHERQAREAGVHEFILKPCSHHDMADLITRLTLRAKEGEA